MRRWCSTWPWRMRSIALYQVRIYFRLKSHVWDPEAEIAHFFRTEIAEGGYKRVALQFPDSMLPDAPKVYHLLNEMIKVGEGLLGIALMLS